MEPAFRAQPPSGLPRLQDEDGVYRRQVPKLVHVSIAIRYIPHFDPKTNELQKVEAQLQNKGTTYRSLERIQRQLNRRAFFVERRSTLRG